MKETLTFEKQDVRGVTEIRSNGFLVGYAIDINVISSSNLADFLDGLCEKVIFFRRRDALIVIFD